MATKKLTVSFPEESIDRITSATKNKSRFLQLATDYVFEHEDVLTKILENIGAEPKSSPVSKKRAGEVGMVTTNDPTEPDGPPSPQQGARCPNCKSNARQQYEWKPDMNPTHLRHRCHDCNDYDSGWVPIAKAMPVKDILDSFQGSKIVKEITKPDPVINCNHLDHDIEIDEKAVYCSNCKEVLHKHKQAQVLNGGRWKCHCGAGSMDLGKTWTAPEEEVW